MTEEEHGLATESVSILLSQPLTYMVRILGVQKFEFGVQKPFVNLRGEDTMLADFHMTAMCRWRIEGPNFRLGTEHYEPERKDDHAKDFYRLMKTDPLVVESLEIQPDGALRMKMTGGYLFAFDAESNDEDLNWSWRFMYPNHPKGFLMGKEGGVTFVVTGQ